MSEDPVDETAEKAIRREKNHLDPYENSVDPPGLEGTGLGKENEEYIEFVKGEERDELVGKSTSKKLSAEKEKDNRGVITDNEDST